MKINITKKEYRVLLDIFEIADWILHAFETEEDPKTKKYSELEQKFFSFAKDIGLKHLVQYDAKQDKYFLAEEHGDQGPAMEFIHEYDNDIFWSELADRLAYRDLIRQEGEENFQKMNFKERFMKMESLREKYMNEFGKNGIERVNIQG